MFKPYEFPAHALAAFENWKLEIENSREADFMLSNFLLPSPLL